MEENPTKETLDEWHNDPSNWKWGIFYYNKKDRRVFLSKRLSFLGFTMNFANPNTLLVLIGFMLALEVITEFLHFIY